MHNKKTLFSFFLGTVLFIFAPILCLQENPSVQKKAVSEKSYKKFIPVIGAGLMVAGSSFWWKLWYVPRDRAKRFSILYADLQKVLMGDHKEILGYNIEVNGKKEMVSGISECEAKNCHRAWIRFKEDSYEIAASILYKRDINYMTMKSKLQEFIQDNYNQFIPAIFYYDINGRGQESYITETTFYHQLSL